MPSRRLVPYLRVSTVLQAEEGLGLEAQLAAIEARVAELGDELLLPSAVDAGLSGTLGLAERPGLAAALERAEAAGGGVVVYRLDRLARDLVLQEQLLADIWRRGLEVVSAAAGEDHYLTPATEDPSRALIRHVLGAVAQYERAVIRLRLAGGRQQKLAREGWAGGRPPYGRRAEGRRLVPDPAAEAALARARDLQPGRSLREVARLLEEAGIPAPGGGTRWHATTLRRLLRRLPQP